MLIKKTIVALGAASFVLLAGGLVGAQTATGTATTTTTTTNTAGDKLASSFSSFAGSDKNAQSLVNGLRTSSTITLESTTGAPSASLSPSTSKMGYGNINIALSLAQTSLAKQGITSPTPTQLADALNGILGQRSQGMGWGKIAQSMGVKLGSVVSASKTDKAGKKSDTSTKSASAGKTTGSTASNAKAGNAAGSGGGKGGGGHGGGGGNARSEERRVGKECRL